MRNLTYHLPIMPKAMFSQLAEWTDPALDVDRYGTGNLITDFEAEIAELLGKEAAVFMPSGTMAQQIALRIWSERKGTPHVAFHPLSHLEIHEQKAYEHLHSLQATLVGEANRLMTLDDVQQIKQPLAALLIELPQREIGGLLPSWADLQALAAYTRGAGIALHLDGARLWECQPFYQRSYAEIVTPFDSVYVSFYKILGGIAGAALVGPKDFIDEARIWQRRHGGNLVMLYPYVLSTKMGMQQHLPQIPQYVKKAQEIAAAIENLPGVERISPNPPHTNMMHIRFTLAVDQLERGLNTLREHENIMLGWVDEEGVMEFNVGSATLEWELDEIVAIFQHWFECAIAE